MLRAAPWLLSVVLMSLSACSGESVPRVVTPSQGHASQADFGALRVYYNLLPTLAMNESVARSYGVQRSADHALLVIALRQRDSTDEQPVDGTVVATATDLSGRQQQIVLRTVKTGAYTDHVGSVRISDHDTLRLAVQVAAAGDTGTLRFERGF
ncbi:MAG: DUF4426 domain-containing protein [Stenotrophomonas sp.]|uniref:DUF4426 domain-containing protein n=1 Tax=Stenotrophomonas sp. TaxID=69392 RepID=UPI003D6D06A2